MVCCQCIECNIFQYINLYPATLLNSLMSSSNVLFLFFFVLGSLGFSMQSGMSSTITDSNISPFPVQIPFISFSCLIPMARTPNTMLNKSIRSRHACLLPDFRGNYSKLSPLRMMLASFPGSWIFTMVSSPQLTPSWPFHKADHTQEQFMSPS